MVVAAQVENDAEEPRPAPMGRVERAVKLNDGLVEIVRQYLRFKDVANNTFHLRAPWSCRDTRKR